MHDLTTTTTSAPSMTDENNNMNSNTAKSKHAVYLFEELKKFQKVGILCDVKLPAKFESVMAHKVVLLSARSNSVESSSSSDYESLPDSKDLFSKEDDQSDVFTVEHAYSPCSTHAPSPTPTVDQQDSTLQRQLDIINNLRLNHECCDVRLVTDDDYCDAHRVVLAACSDYFRAMFITSRMMENDLTTVKLQGITGQCFRKILGFMYTGEISFSNFEDTVKLLDISVYYQITPLVERCVSYLETNIVPETICYLTWISKELALQDLTDTCLSYITNHFSELSSAGCEIGILAAADFLSCLTSAVFPQGTDALAFETSVLTSVLHWFAENHAMSSSSIQQDILNQVRLSLIPSSVITECCDMVMKSVPDRTGGYNISAVFGSLVHSYISDALQYHEKLFSQPLMSMAKHQLRGDNYSIVSIDGVMADKRVKVQESAKNISLYSGPDAVHVPECPDGKLRAIRDPYHNVIEMNGFLYLIGGTRKFCAGFRLVTNSL